FEAILRRGTAVAEPADLAGVRTLVRCGGRGSGARHLRSGFHPHCRENSPESGDRANARFHPWVVPRRGMGNSGKLSTPGTRSAAGPWARFLVGNIRNRTPSPTHAAVGSRSRAVPSPAASTAAGDTRVVPVGHLPA